MDGPVCWNMLGIDDLQFLPVCAWEGRNYGGSAGNCCNFAANSFFRKSCRLSGGENCRLPFFYYFGFHTGAGSVVLVFDVVTLPVLVPEGNRLAKGEYS